jgi:hypothetical protein
MSSQCICSVPWSAQRTSSVSCIGSVSRRSLPRLNASTSRPSKPTVLSVTLRSCAWKLNFMGVVPRCALGMRIPRCFLGAAGLLAAATPPAREATELPTAAAVHETADAPLAAAGPLTAAAECVAPISKRASPFAVPSTARSSAESTEALPRPVAAPKGLVPRPVAAPKGFMGCARFRASYLWEGSRDPAICFPAMQSDSPSRVRVNLS